MNSDLTGTQNLRLGVLQNHWLVEEAHLSPKFLLANNLYTVPIGQTFPAEVLVISGNVEKTDDTINIEKVKHIFSKEEDLENFLNEVGRDHVSSFYQIAFTKPDGTQTTHYIVELLNYPKISFRFDLQNCRLEKGFKVKVFRSGTFLEELKKEKVFNEKGIQINDTYLVNFELFDK